MKKINKPTDLTLSKGILEQLKFKGVELIKDFSKKLPNKPGVYQMESNKGEILYIGKAKNLSKRVINYGSLNNLTRRLQRMVNLTTHINFFVTNTEIEALLLECNLIKRHKPRFNILLKDSKSYPFIEVSLSDEFPRFSFYRGKKDRKGAVYFGPYPNVNALRDISNILNFKNAYKDAKIVKLEENYRSTQNILDAAWSVVSRNKNRADKKLWTKNIKGDQISMITAYNERDEAFRIVKDMSRIKNAHNISYSKFLILYRTNAQSRAIEDVLIKNGILYNVVGGVKFYDRKEVKDILAYMRFIVNPCDTVSFDRIVNFPIRGIGKVALDKIHTYADKKKVSYYDSLSDLKNMSLSAKQFKELLDNPNSITSLDNFH